MVDMSETTRGGAEELVDLARRIHAWQDKTGMTTAALIREFRGIGSDRTFRDLREGATGRYDVEAQLASYRLVWAQIEALDERAAEAPIYEDLSTVCDLRRAVLAAMRTSGINRVVMTYGGSGMGKSTAMEWLMRKYGQRIMRVEASTVWEDRPGSLLGAILKTLGAAGLPASAEQRLERVIDLLGRSRRMMAVDEAQHLGPRLMGTIKTLVNQTPGEWVLLSMGTLRGRMDLDAYQEARQLLTNRLCEVVVLKLTREDVERYLRHSFPSADRRQLKAGAALLRDAADNQGNLSFVRDAVTVIRDMTAEGEQPTAQTIAEAVKAVAAKR